VKEGRVKRTDIQHKMCCGTYGFFFNTRSAFFHDTKVRQAISYLFDFDWASKNLFFSQYQRNLSYFPNAPFEAKGIPEGLEKDILIKFQDKLPQSVFHEPFTFTSFKTSQDQRKALEQVLKLFDEAGWVLKDQHLVSKKTGKVFEFEILIPDKGLEKVALHLQSCLKRAGVTMNIRLLDVSTYQERVENFDFDMIIGGIGQSLTPGNEQISYWGSESAKMKGSKNWAGIQNPVVDELIKKLVDAKTYEELSAYVKALDRVLLWNFYMIPAWHKNSIPVFYWNSFAFMEHPVYQPSGYSYWWKDKADMVQESKAQTWIQWLVEKWKAFLAFLGIHS
jgi:microcin C transport system substrate-binding protein